MRAGEPCAYYHCAEKKAILAALVCGAAESQMRLLKARGMPNSMPKGRYLRADFGKLSMVSLLPFPGSSSPERQEAKFRFMALFYPHLLDLAKSGRDVVVCGDWNIAHLPGKRSQNWKGGNAGIQAFFRETDMGRPLAGEEAGEMFIADFTRQLQRIVTPGGLTAVRNVGEKRRLAAGLSIGDASACGNGACSCGL